MLVGTFLKSWAGNGKCKYVRWHTRNFMDGYLYERFINFDACS